MALPRKRTVLAWATIGILSADVAQSAFRLALCSSTPEADQPSICREGPVTVAVLTAKIRTLMAVWAQAERMQVEEPPALSPEGTQLQQPVNAQEF
jgi:uncharacterized membrane protein YidH (DUF202 family)